jgi:hypothetical protein
LQQNWFAQRQRFGPVAQRIEQQPSKLKVAGSIPAGVASIFDKRLRAFRQKPEHPFSRGAHGGAGYPGIADDPGELRKSQLKGFGALTSSEPVVRRQ